MSSWARAIREAAQRQGHSQANCFKQDKVRPDHQDHLWDIQPPNAHIILKVPSTMQEPGTAGRDTSIMRIQESQTGCQVEDLMPSKPEVGRLTVPLDDQVSA